MSLIKPKRKYALPMDIPYLTKLIFSLTTIGSWPYEVIGEKKWFADVRNSKVLFPIWIFFHLLQISYLRKNANRLSFLDLGRQFINVLMSTVCVQRITMTWKKLYINMTKNFVCKMHLFHHKDKNYFAMKTFSTVEKISTFFSRILHLELYVGVVLFNLTPLYNSYRRGMFNSIKPLNATYDQACFYDLPFDYMTNFNGFLAVFILNCFLTYDVAGSVCIMDLYIFVLLFHLWGHIKILKNNLNSFPKPKMKGQSSSIQIPSWYTKEESQNITNLLIESIEYYKIINEFMNQISSVFGATICFYLLFHQISGCLLLVELSEMTTDAFGTYGILTFTLLQQLIQMSIAFELIGSQSETIKDAVYGVPWECMDTKNRKLVIIYLFHVQEPFHLKALGLLPVGVKTMASILKTSLSYFLLLRASTAKHNEPNMT